MLPEFAKHDDTIVKQVWIKKSNPQQPYKSFEEMIRAHPECSVDNEGEPWICLDECDWIQWVNVDRMKCQRCKEGVGECYVRDMFVCRMCFDEWTSDVNELFNKFHKK